MVLLAASYKRAGETGVRRALTTHMKCSFVAVVVVVFVVCEPDFHFKEYMQYIQT